MKYYIVQRTMDPKIVGSDFPQVHKFIKGYDPEGPNALFSLYKYWDSFPDYVPDLDGLMVSGSSKLTDILNNGFSSDFHIMSERTKNLFENYTLCPHRFYPVGLYKRNIKYNYYILHIMSNYTDFVDYEKSNFAIHDFICSSGYEAIDINSKSEYFEARAEVKKSRGVTWGIQGIEIVMTDQFDSNTDFFEICILDTNLYISERLKLAIESMGLTGWDFIPATNLIVPDVND